MKLIDAHTHISSEDFDSDRAEVLSRARTKCSAMIDIGSGTSPLSHFRARDLAEAEGDIFFTAGIHPHDAESLGQDTKIRSEVESLLPHTKCVAVGECGLDYYYDHSPKEVQHKVFEWQIELAKKHQMPLMIHTREADDDTMSLLKDYDGTAIFHCFTSSQKLADFGIEKNFFISFSGIITFKNAGDLREVFLKTPLENILIETDAPYLAPVPMRGKRNETSFLEHTAKFLADLRGIDVTELAEATTQNALRCFSRLNISRS